MTERWARLKAIFHDALEQPSATRGEWLARACGGDEALRLDAEALLAAHETAGGFLENAAVLDPEDLSTSILTRGTRVGAYRIIDELGRGGMGVVYLAEDERLGRRVALKSLSPDIAADPASRERLRREARAAATISHPAIAVVHALEEIGDQLFIVAEYVRGRTLRYELQHGPLEPSRAAAIVADVTRGLSAAHAAGVIHRDLKPENVLITDDGSVKVVDFGIAHLPGSEAMRLTMAGALLGTPAYMAPEQLVGAPTDARADIYSLGLLFGEMLTGQLARHGSPALSELDPLGTRSDVLRLGSDPFPPFRGIVERCTQHDPAARYGSAGELLADLESALGELRTGRPVAMRGGSAALWWWQFHQGVAALTYGLMLIPAWGARAAVGGRGVSVLFTIVVAAVVAAAALRLHLWFTSRFYPSELSWLHARVLRWVRAADIIVVAGLSALGLVASEQRAALAALLIAFSIGATVGFLAIEPATARAAFARPSAANR